MTRSRMISEKASPVGPGQPGDRLLAACSGGGAVPEPLDGGAEQPALHRIVVDDEDRYRHVLNCKAPFSVAGTESPRDALHEAAHGFSSRDDG